MATELPEGYSNVRYKFSCAGIPEETSTAHGVGLTIGMTAGEIALACHVALFDSGIILAANMLAGWTYIGTECTRMESTGPVIGEQNTTQAGTIAQNGVPSNCAYLIRKQTASGGRKHRGRMFFPPVTFLSSSVDDAGNIAGAQITNFQAKLDDWFNDMVTAGVQPVLLHSDPVDVPTDITGFALQGQLATQRRRMR